MRIRRILRLSRECVLENLAFFNQLSYVGVHRSWLLSPNGVVYRNARDFNFLAGRLAAKSLFVPVCPYPPILIGVD